METVAHVYEAFEYDLSLTAEQLQIRDTARRFAAEVLRAAGIAIDRMAPEAAIAPGSPLQRRVSGRLCSERSIGPECRRFPARCARAADGPTRHTGASRSHTRRR